MASKINVNVLSVALAVLGSSAAAQAQDNDFISTRVEPTTDADSGVSSSHDDFFSDLASILDGGLALMSDSKCGIKPSRTLSRDAE